MQLYQSFFKYWDVSCHYFLPVNVVHSFQLGLQTLHVIWTAFMGHEKLSPYHRGTLAPSNHKITLADWHVSLGNVPKAINALNDLCIRFKREHWSHGILHLSIIHPKEFCGFRVHKQTWWQICGRHGYVFPCKWQNWRVGKRVGRNSPCIRWFACFK